MKTMFPDKTKKNKKRLTQVDGEGTRSTAGKLNYKQLWCAPLQKRCSLGKQNKPKTHSMPKKPTMKHNATTKPTM